MQGFLLLLPSGPLSRVVGFLDSADARGLRCTCTCLKEVMDKLARLASARYVIAKAEEFDGVDSKAVPDQPLLLPSRRAQDLGPFTEEEYYILCQLAVVDAKLLALSRAPNRKVGSILIDAMPEKLLPPDFAQPIREFSELGIASVLPESSANFASYLNFFRRPVYFGPKKLLQHVASVRSDLLIGCDSAEADECDRMEEEGQEEGQEEGLEVQVVDEDEDERSFQMDLVERQRIDMIISGSSSEQFYNFKQDALNGIVNVMEDQYLFCSKLLRFQAKTPEAINLAMTVAAASENVWLTPDRVKSLYKHGFCIVDNFLPPELVSAVNSTCLHFVQQTVQLMALPRETLAGLTEMPYFVMSRGDPPSARGDCLLWLNRDSSPGNMPPFLQVLDVYTKLYEEVGSVVKLQGGREAQLAFYPDKGQGYRRHRDATPDDGEQPTDNRRVTAITYCNPMWEEHHGGHLRVWLSHLKKQPVLELEPCPGRLFLFLSGLIDHEVRPSFFPRVAVTSWFW